MQYELSEDNKRIRETVRRVALEKVAPRAAEIDAKAEYPQGMFDVLKDLGFSHYHSMKNMEARIVF